MKWKIGDLAVVRRSTMANKKNGWGRVDDVGPIISIRGKTKGHTNLHKYEIQLLRGSHFTNKPVKPSRKQLRILYELGRII